MPCVTLKKKIKGGPTLPALYTKSPSKSYKLSEKHDVYAKDIRQIPVDLPPPRAALRSKSEIIDISEYLLVDDRALRVPLTVLSKPVEALVDYLTNDYEDELSKVRVLYRWLTNQPIARMKVLEQEPKSSGSALHHLWLLKTKKKRYTQLFSLLCRFAELYCVTIHGAVKGVHYQVGDRIDMERHYGEWNAVCIEGEWRFVDALWGACDVTDHGDGRGRFTCDERFFLTDAKDLIYTHFAASERWQLLDSPRHIESFEEAACLKSRFFDLGMQVLSHPLCEIQSEEGEVEIIFGLQPKKSLEQTFNCYISHFDRPDTKRYLSRGSNFSVPTFIHNLTESSVSFKVRFPERGVFRLEIVGKELDTSSPFRDLDWIAVYKVLVEEHTDRGFPKMDSIGWGPGQEVLKIGLAPFNYTSGVIVAKNVQTKVRFKIVDTMLVQDMKFFFKIASTYDNDYSVNSVSDKFDVDLNIMTFFIEVPPFGEYTLKMFARKVRGNVTAQQRREINICNYLLISDMPQRETPLGILTEKTEIADDQPVQPRPKSLQKEPAESVVSASNVLMDSNSALTETILHDSPEVPKAKTPVETLKDNQPPVRQESPKKLIQKPPSPMPTAAPPGTPEQTFVRVDGALQEIPEIPLNVVKAIDTSKQTAPSPEPQEHQPLKVVSSNRVVPLKSEGGKDDSVMLVPAQDKPARPMTGVRRGRTRDDTKFFTALAHVRGEKR